MKRTVIYPKNKPCRSEGKAKGFPGCGKPTLYRKYGLGIDCKCYAKWLLNTPEGAELIKRQTIPLQKKRDEFKQAEKEYKERETLPSLLISVKEVFHKYVRLRDAGKSCACCGIPYMESFDAGHLFPANKYPEIRFDEYNVHGQAVQCNRYKEGNFSEYILHVESRIGKDQLQRLISIAENSKKELFKWDRSELLRLKSYYQQKLKELKSKQ